MTTIKVKAEGRIGYDIVDARIAGKSMKPARREAARRVRHNLKTELREQFVSGDVDEELWAVKAAKEFAERIRRESGYGAGCVSIIRGKVVVL